jgi:hypothetical protein
VEEVQDFIAVKEGIPHYAVPELLAIIIPPSSHGIKVLIPSKFLKFQTVSHQDIGIAGTGVMARSDLYAHILSLVTRSSKGQTILADLVQFELMELGLLDGSRYQREASQKIDRILRNAGSSFTVGRINNRYGLVHRIPAATIEISEHIISSAVKASDLLRRAWDNAFGRDPKPSHAYSDAVRAVEVYSCPLVSPKDVNATLGKDINVLKNAPHKWEFTMSGAGQQSSVEPVLAMMQLLWHSQDDRHGGAEYADVSVDQAQAAVLLASTLVGWFDRGFLTRREG